MEEISIMTKKLLELDNKQMREFFFYRPKTNNKKGLPLLKKVAKKFNQES